MRRLRDRVARSGGGRSREAAVGKSRRCGGVGSFRPSSLDPPRRQIVDGILPRVMVEHTRVGCRFVGSEVDGAGGRRTVTISLLEAC